MSRPALPEEVGADLFREGDEPPAPELCHDVERVDDHDGPPYGRCANGCGEAGPVGSVNPWERCGAVQQPTRVETRAEAAEDDDGQEALPA